MSEQISRFDAPFSAFADCRSRPNPSFADALRHAIEHGLPQAPLFRGGADGRHSLGFLGDDAWPKRLSAGPDGWRCAGAARAWARYAVVHAAAGAESHYSAISEAVRHHHHVLCVETSSAFREAWRAIVDFLTQRAPPGTRGATAFLPDGRELVITVEDAIALATPRSAER